MLNKEEASKIMSDLVARIEDVMNVVHQFKESRPSEKALTHLEEAIMWLNVMVHHVELRPAPITTTDETSVENKVESAVA